MTICSAISSRFLPDIALGLCDISATFIFLRFPECNGKTNESVTNVVSQLTEAVLLISLLQATVFII